MSRNGTGNGNGNGRYRPVAIGAINEDGPTGTGPIISAPITAADVLPAPTKYTPSGTIPNTPFFASFISWSLGGIFWVCLTSGIVLLALRQGWWDGVSWTAVMGQGKWTRWVRPQLAFYLASWSLFHQLEFWTTAACNVDRLSVDAFLLNNGKQYHTAHLIGLTEYFITCYFINDTSASVIPANILALRKWWMSYGSLVIALPPLIAAQALRALAMVHAAGSFSHVVSRSSNKQEGHVLVTSGVYRISRHPAYTGFFYWALSTQLLLGNTVSFIGFWLVLSNFFKWRIIDEEIHLVRYFGDAYLRFRQRTGHWLPVNTDYKPYLSSAAQGKAKATVLVNGGANGKAVRKDQ